MTEWLVDTLIATSVLIAIVLLIRAQVTRLFGARVAYALWAIPAARFFMPAIEKTVILPAEPAVRETGASTVILTQEVQAIAQEPPFDWTPLLLTLWLGGAIALFLWRMATYLQEREDILAEARPVDTIDGIHIVEAPMVSGPLAVGLFRKYIAIPQHFERDYNAAERELALGHELAHHKSGDLLVNFAGFVILCLHWFNPLAWFAWRSFRFDQELACDERVLATRSDHLRGTYGRAVAKAASGHAPIFASALNNRESLKKRLIMMKRAKVSGKRRLTGMATIGLGLAIALPLTATVSYAYVQEETPADEERTVLRYAFVTDGDDAEHAELAALQGIDAGEDANVDLEFEDEAEDGQHRVLRIRRDASEGEDGERRVERRIIRHRGDHDIPSREELRAMIPDIDVEEACDGSATPVHSVRRQGENGREHIAITICREGLAQEARMSAIEGLREAREELAQVRELSETLRADILRDLDREIAELERNRD